MNGLEKRGGEFLFSNHDLLLEGGIETGSILMVDLLIVPKKKKASN